MKILKADQEGSREIMLFGTGSPLRQVLYAQDLARVIVLMIQNNIYENMNVASKDNFSIGDYTQKILDILGFSDWEIKFDPSKPDGQYRKDVSIQKLISYFPNFEFTPFEKGILAVYETLKLKDISKN
jgi:GDP-L-fucose synthase